MPKAGSPELTLIRSTSTELLATECHTRDDVHLWVHRLGTDAPRPFASLPIDLSNSADRALVTNGTGDDRERSYSTAAGWMVFDLLAAGEPSRLAATGRRWGKAIRSLHETAVLTDRGAARPPRTLQRATAWTSGRWQPAREELGERGLWEIRRWLNEMVSPPRPVVVHGHPGMAHWVGTADGTGGTLLFGEDTGLAASGYDISWILGEIAELYAFHSAWRPALDHLRAGFLAECGSITSSTDIALGIAFRLAQHAYDWHTYAGADEEQARMLLRLATSYLNTQGNVNRENQ